MSTDAPFRIWRELRSTTYTVRDTRISNHQVVATFFGPSESDNRRAARRDAHARNQKVAA